MEAQRTASLLGVDPRPVGTAPRWVVPAAAATAALVRLPLLAAPADADEAGFLVIARDWAGPGTSLYGDYWVDRPPLLLLLFRMADLIGGLVPLRLLGTLAVVLTVVASARTAQHLAGPRAAAWTAVLTAALLSSPSLQAQQVNGELLAVPFVAGGLLAMVAALDRTDPRQAATLAATSGAAAVAALMVKQNIGDVLVSDVVLLAALVAAGRLTPRRAVRLGGCVLAGAGAAVVALLVLAWTRGASPTEVLDAAYWFRVEALGVLADQQDESAGRATSLAARWALSGLAPALVLLCAHAAARRTPVLLALTAVALLDLLSVGLGGSYWAHYLVQPAVPLALALGLLAGAARVGAGPPRARLPRRLPAAAVVTAFVVGSATVTLASSSPRLLGEADPLPTRLGEAIGEVASPGDTITALHGRPQVNLASGLPSPYPYLWSLPIRVRDPGLRDLETLLRSERRPTWLVLGPETATWGPSFDLGAVLYQHYTAVTVREGLTVYLRRDVKRPDPWSTNASA